MQRTESRHLPVKLTQREVLTKSKIAAKGMHELKSLEDDKAEVTKDYAEKIKKKRRDLDTLASEVHTGTEVRPVECDLMPRWSEHMMDLVRPDTGEVVESRPMTHSEKQTEMSLRQPSLPEVDGRDEH